MVPFWKCQRLALDAKKTYSNETCQIVDPCCYIWLREPRPFCRTCLKEFSGWVATLRSKNTSEHVETKRREVQDPHPKLPRPQPMPRIKPQRLSPTASWRSYSLWLTLLGHSVALSFAAAAKEPLREPFQHSGFWLRISTERLFGLLTVGESNMQLQYLFSG